MNVCSNSPHITVVQPYFHAGHWTATRPNRAAAGDVWYSSTNNCFEVFDGNSWCPMAGHADVGMSPQANDAIEWAIKKMREEREIEKLAQENYAVQNALDAVRKAEEQLKIVAHIAKPEYND